MRILSAYSKRPTSDGYVGVEVNQLVQEVDVFLSSKLHNASDEIWIKFERVLIDDR